MLARLDDAAFRKFFSGSPIKRIGRDRFIRNVLIAIGNSADNSLAAEAERLLDDDEPRGARRRDLGIATLGTGPRFETGGSEACRGANTPMCVTSGPPQRARPAHDKAFRFSPSASQSSIASVTSRMTSRSRAARSSLAPPVRLRLVRSRSAPSRSGDRDRRDGDQAADCPARADRPSIRRHTRGRPAGHSRA